MLFNSYSKRKLWTLIIEAYSNFVIELQYYWNSFLQGAFSRLDPTGEFADHMVDTIPVGRMGEKQELSNLAMYFLSNYSSWCSGTVINFDGGQLPFMAGMFNPLVKVRGRGCV